jgi:molecular chaperone DnaK (HSP70)
LTRSEFEQITQHLVDMLRIPVERCLRDLAAKSGKVDSLVLAGGTCKIPAVRDLAEDLVGLAPVSGLDPLTAIAEGAAIVAGIMQGELPGYGFFVSTEHALGTKIQNQVTGVQEFSVIIPRGRILPAEDTEIYTPLYDDQESIIVEVMEGDPEKPLGHQDNVVLAQQEIQIPNPGPMEGISFAVTFKYDLDGIVHYDVVDQRDGASLYAGEIVLGVQRDKRQMVGIANRVQTTLKEGLVQQSDEVSDLDPEVATAVLDSRTKVAPFVDDDEAAKIMGLCEQIESSGGTDQDAVDQLLEIIHRYNYLL